MIVKSTDRHQTMSVLLRQWAEENGPPDILMKSPGSKRIALWRCDQGHTWQARIYAVAAGSGCPYCAGYKAIPGKTDLATTHSELAAQFDADKNQISVREVSKGCTKTVWWRCPEGHSYQAPVYARVAGTGCPYCAGKKALPGFNDLQTTDPALAGEWDDQDVKPTEVTRGSHKAVWWKCPKGHRYEAPVYSRAAGNGCPYCSGRKVLKGFNDLATTHPVVAAQWEQTLNGALTPEMVTKGSNKKVWWRCSAGHVWQAAVFSRTRKRASDCPVCTGVAKRRFAQRYKTEPARTPSLTPARLPEVAAAAVNHDE